ncbi:hypothetical protein VaNZ11_011124, partial [Volvox africanus]
LIPAKDRTNSPSQALILGKLRLHNSSTMPLVPTVLWAQRSDKLYLTIDVQDVKDQSCDLEDEKLTFKGKAGTEQNEYSLDLTFNAAVDSKSEDSKISITPRNIFIIIKKKESGHWPRLTKESGRHLTHIKCDWDKWVDEDEEDEKPEADFSGMDFSSFGGMGGMGGMGGLGGMDFSNFGGEDEGGAEAEEELEDSDNEELPDLVKP